MKTSDRGEGLAIERSNTYKGLAIEYLCRFGKASLINDSHGDARRTGPLNTLSKQIPLSADLLNTPVSRMPRSGTQVGLSNGRMNGRAGRRFGYRTFEYLVEYLERDMATFEYP